MRSLNRYLPAQRAISYVRMQIFKRFWGMDIDPTAKVSLKANLDRTYPVGIRVGAYSWIAFGATLLTHDRTRGIYKETTVGQNCFIGAHSIILPGVTIGDNCVVAAGAVVTKNVRSRTIVAGNPAREIRADIEVGRYGRFKAADERVQHKLT